MATLKDLRPALPILIGASLMLSLAMGLRQSLGLFMPPLTKDIGITVSDFTLAIAVQNLSWGLLQPLAGAYAVRVGYRPLMLGGSLLYLLGLLVSSAGVGAVAGMVYLAMRSSIVGLFRLIGLTAAVAGGSLLLFTLTAKLWLGMLLICMTGMAMMLTAASTNTVVQTFVPDGLRSRVAAIYMLCFLGVSPFGALANGWVADHLGAPSALAHGIDADAPARALVLTSRPPWPPRTPAAPRAAPPSASSK